MASLRRDRDLKSHTEAILVVYVHIIYGIRAQNIYIHTM